MNKKSKGQKGEELALLYLKEQKIIILEKNFRSRYGEIDLIGLNKKDKKLIFYEVKYRENENYGDAGYSINKKKQEKILKTALFFLSINSNYTDHDIRFDAVLLKNKNNIIKLLIIENIISADNFTNGIYY